MVRLFDIGPYGYKRGRAVASLNYAPPSDRESLVCSIYVRNQSANDVWRVSVGGRELMAFVHNSTGNQQLLGGLNAGFPKTRNLFKWYYDVFGNHLTIPVPVGQSITVKSDAGATADIDIEYMDFTPNSIPPTAVNHYQGNNFLLPHYASLAAAASAAGEKLLDTFVQPTWMTNVFSGTQFPTGWSGNVRAMFLETAGRNAYAAATDHLSSLNYLAFVQDGQRLFTHDVDGIPLEPSAAAAGSANTVYGTNSQVFPPFQAFVTPDAPLLDMPFRIRGGDNIKVYASVAGDVGAGADFSGVYQVALVEYMQGG